MTTLYVPVKITSAEQAESLPEGTVAISERFAPEAFTKDGGSWLGTHSPGEFTNLSAVGLTALVPIEDMDEDDDYDYDYGYCEQCNDYHDYDYDYCEQCNDYHDYGEED